MDKTHPNRRNFEGVLTRLGIPSDEPLAGSRSHLVLLPEDVARDALPSLIGMPVGFGSCWGVHNYRQRCGIIEHAWIDGDELRVRGYLFDRDFPEVAQTMSKGLLGMSVEMADNLIADLSADVWVIQRVTFIGAAILFASKAAYKSTRIWLSASASDDEEMELSIELVLKNVVGEGGAE